MSPWIVLAVTVGLIAASAFFVAVEFALIAARRSPPRGRRAHSRAARAALRSASELSVLLAGSQLGITVCTLALGAITKPAVHHWLTPGLPRVGRTAVAGRRRRVRAGADHRHLPAPGGRRDGTEVVGDRTSGAVGDPAGDPDARLHVVDPPRPGRAEPDGELVPAQGRGDPGRSGRVRAGPGRAAAPGRALRDRRHPRRALPRTAHQRPGTRGADRRRTSCARTRPEQRAPGRRPRTRSARLRSAAGTCGCWCAATRRRRRRARARQPAPPPHVHRAGD